MVASCSHKVLRRNDERAWGHVISGLGRVDWWRWGKERMSCRGLRVVSKIGVRGGSWSPVKYPSLCPFSRLQP